MTFWDLVDKHPKKIIFIFILFLIIVFSFFKVSFSQDKGLLIAQDENKEITITLISANDNNTISKNSTFSLHEKECKLAHNFQEKIQFICPKPDELGEFSYLINNNTSGKLTITKDKHTYDINNTDGNLYFIKPHSQDLVYSQKDKKLLGKILLLNKSNEITKFRDYEENYKFSICGQQQEGIIENGYLTFGIKWKDTFNAYHRNCKNAVEFKIDNIIYKTRKPYFLTEDTPLEIFCPIQNADSTKTYDFNLIKIKNNSIIIANNKKISLNIPNITLRSFSPKEVPNYLKYTINDININTIFSFYLSDQLIFRFDYPYIKTDNANYDLRSHNKANHGIIKKLEILYNQNKNNNYSIKIIVDNAKPVKFNSDIKESNKEKAYNQLVIENTPSLKNTGQNILFKINNIESGDILYENILY
jgi:hypothetical protein